MSATSGCTDHQILVDIPVEEAAVSTDLAALHGEGFNAPRHDANGSLTPPENIDFAPAFERGENCPDCGARPGNVHHEPCTHARIPGTGIQAKGRVTRTLDEDDE
jgi:hypothetical protein